MAAPMNCRIEPSKNPTVWSQPLDSVEFLSSLKSFQSLLESCMGPGGGIKMLITTGGCVTLTSSSNRLVNNIVFSNPVLLLILNVVKNQLKSCSDFGLHVGFTISSLLQHALVSEVPKGLRCKLLAEICSMCVAKLQVDGCPVAVKVDFQSVKCFLPIVKGIVQSKASCRLLDEEVSHLSIQILKAFLQTVPDHKVKSGFGHVAVVCQEGPSVDCSKMFHGVLYRAPEIDPCEKWAWKPVPCRHEDGCEDKIGVVLFDIMLTNIHDSEESINATLEMSRDFRHYNPVVERITSLYQQFGTRGVSIFACQKVVHSRIRELFQKNGVLVLERLGTDLAHSLAKLSGAVPISSVTVQDICPYVGHLESISHVVIHDKSYFLMENKESAIATVLVHSLTEENVEDLKHVTNQTLDTLSQFVVNPIVVPGAGCLEAWLIPELEKEVWARIEHLCTLHSSTRTHVMSVLTWVQKTLLQICKQLVSTTSVLVTDSIYHHAWRLKNTTILSRKWSDGVEDTCSCGLVRKLSVQDQRGDWFELTVGNVFVDIKADSCPEWTIDRMSENSVVDVYTNKVNAIKLAFETVENILNIGMIISVKA